MKLVWKPQIFLALLVLGSVAMASLFLDGGDVAKVAIGGAIAIGMRLVEKN